MKKFMALAAVAALAFSVSACTTPGERAAGGALIGGGAGAAIGAAAGGGRGALIGAGIGAASGAIIGAATTPTAGACPRGYYLARDGYCYPI